MSKEKKTDYSAELLNLVERFLERDECTDFDECTDECPGFGDCVIQDAKALVAKFKKS
jgi:hypothetical protein